MYFPDPRGMTLRKVRALPLSSFSFPVQYWAVIAELGTLWYAVIIHITREWKCQLAQRDRDRCSLTPSVTLGHWTGDRQVCENWTSDRRDVTFTTASKIRTSFRVLRSYPEKRWGCSLPAPDNPESHQVSRNLGQPWPGHDRDRYCRQMMVRNNPRLHRLPLACGQDF
jgi:hypothetical protein